MSVLHGSGCLAGGYKDHYPYKDHWEQPVWEGALVVDGVKVGPVSACLGLLVTYQMTATSDSLAQGTVNRRAQVPPLTKITPIPSHHPS
jgi:hypothetical protein